MKILLLGKRSLVAFALASKMKEGGMDFEWLSYNQISNENSSFFDSYSHVFNCIAYTNVDKAEEEKELAYAINNTFVRRLASSRCKLIHYSTDYVFDGKSSKVYNEMAETAPLSVYGKTKLEGEMAALNKKDALVIRTSWVYGPSKTNFAQAVLKNMVEKKEVRIVSNQHSKATYSLDLATASLNLISQSGLFHFANEGIIDRLTFAKKMKELAGLDCSIALADPSEFNVKAKRPPFSALSTEKYERVTGLPVRDWQEPLEEYIKELRGAAC